MMISESTKFTPGSTLAIEKGCTCKENPENPEMLSISPDCPIHWHINLVSKTLDVHKIATDAVKENAQLYRYLIMLAIFMCILLWVKA